MKMNLRSALLSSALLGLLTATASAQEAAAAGVHHKTLADLFIEGGWVMYPITLCSVAMMWFMVDGFIKTSPPAPRSPTSCGRASPSPRMARP